MNPSPKPVVPADPRELLDRLTQQLRSGSLELPMPPETAAQVLSVCRDPEISPMEIARLMERDPALMGNVLRIANSAAYGGSERIVSLQHAVARLGSRTINEIAIAAVVRATVFAVPRYHDEVARVWSHSVVAAAWAREVARRSRRNVDGAYLSGLLHDVGRPVLMHVVSGFEDQRGSLYPRPLVLDVVDRLHPEAGAELARRWDFPEWVAVAIAWHHEPEGAGEYRDEVMIVALAARLASWTLETPGGPIDLGADPAVQGLSLEPGDLAALIEMRDRMAESLAA